MAKSKAKPVDAVAVACYTSCVERDNKDFAMKLPLFLSAVMLAVFAHHFATFSL